MTVQSEINLQKIDRSMYNMHPDFQDNFMVKKCVLYSKFYGNVRYLYCAREITCHMGSHSVTGHPIEVILTPLPWHVAAVASTHLSTLEG